MLLGAFRGGNPLERIVGDSPICPVVGQLPRYRLMGSVGSVLTFVADAAPGLAHDIIINGECELILR